MPSVLDVIEPRKTVLDVIEAPTTRPQAPSAPVQAVLVPPTSAQGRQVPPVAQMAPEIPQSFWRGLSAPVEPSEFLQDPSDYHYEAPPIQPDTPATKAAKARIAKYGQPSWWESV